MFLNKWLSCSKKTLRLPYASKALLPWPLTPGLARIWVVPILLVKWEIGQYNGMTGLTSTFRGMEVIGRGLGYMNLSFCLSNLWIETRTCWQLPFAFGTLPATPLISTWVPWLPPMIFGFRPHGRPADAVGDYHRRKNQKKLAKPFTISPAMIN